MFFLVTVLVLRSSFFALRLSYFAILCYLLRFLVFIVSGLLHALFAGTRSIIRAVTLVFFLPFDEVVISVLRPAMLTTLCLLSRRVL